jgi:hypothetical protein
MRRHVAALLSVTPTPCANDDPVDADIIRNRPWEGRVDRDDSDFEPAPSPARPRHVPIPVDRLFPDFL